MNSIQEPLTAAFPLPSSNFAGNSIVRNAQIQSHRTRKATAPAHFTDQEGHRSRKTNSCAEFIGNSHRMSTYEILATSAFRISTYGKRTGWWATLQSSLFFPWEILSHLESYSCATYRNNSHGMIFLQENRGVGGPQV